MKKTILVIVIAVMVATPCFAQEVEPEGIFSIEGTRWQSLPTGVQLLPFPSLVPIDWGFGFYGGEASRYHTYFCIDMIVCSIFYVGIHPGAGGGPGADHQRDAGGGRGQEDDPADREAEGGERAETA